MSFTFLFFLIISLFILSLQPTIKNDKNWKISAIFFTMSVGIFILSYMIIIMPLYFSESISGISGGRLNENKVLIKFNTSEKGYTVINPEKLDSNNVSIKYVKRSPYFYIVLNPINNQPFQDTYFSRLFTFPFFISLTLLAIYAIGMKKSLNYALKVSILDTISVLILSLFVSLPTIMWLFISR